MSFKIVIFIIISHKMDIILVLPPVSTTSSYMESNSSSLVMEMRDTIFISQPKKDQIAEAISQIRPKVTFFIMNLHSG
jgi:hypothetical protein